MQDHGLIQDEQVTELMEIGKDVSAEKREKAKGPDEDEHGMEDMVL